MENRILIVDDEQDITEMLQCFFVGRGYCVMTANTGMEALKQAEHNPDLILLDVNMPEIDGFTICQRIRQFISCPILFLTARVEEMDKVKGFSVGGDDYIVKPFSLVELDARVSAHLRRQLRSVHSSKIKFTQALSIDYGMQKVFIHQQEIPFAKKDFAIIQLLSQNAKQIFDKERIYELIWGYDADGSSSVVAEHIRKIRATFSEYSKEEQIETVWGVGYRWKDE